MDPHRKAVTGVTTGPMLPAWLLVPLRVFGSFLMWGAVLVATLDFIFISVQTLLHW